MIEIKEYGGSYMDNRSYNYGYISYFKNAVPENGVKSDRGLTISGGDRRHSWTRTYTLVDRTQ